jgi:hypothetical protein
MQRVEICYVADLADTTPDGCLELVIYSSINVTTQTINAVGRIQDVDFGSNNCGICAATPTDLMHAFLEGVLKYLLRLWVDPLPPDKKTKIDYLIRHIFGHIRNSEMDPSTFLKKNFTHGYTNLTQLTADEWAGMTFTLLVILQSQEGKDILRHGLLPAMERVVTKEGRPVVDRTPICHVDQSNTNSLSALGTYEDKLSNVDSMEDDEIASDDNDNGSVNVTFLSLWELTEILERLLAFHAFYKRGAP